MRYGVDRFRPLDALLIAGLLAAPVWALVSRRAGVTAATAEISRDNRVIGTYPLARDRTISVGPDVRFEVRDGRLRVLESDCPKSVCLHAGWVSQPGQSIICVPNRVVVTIRGGNPAYDVESH